MLFTDFLKIFTLDSVLNKQLLKVLLWNMLLEGFFELDENPFGFFTDSQYFKTFIEFNMERISVTVNFLSNFCISFTYYTLWDSGLHATLLLHYISR